MSKVAYLIAVITLVGLCTPGDEHWWGPWAAMTLAYVVPVVYGILRDQGPIFALTFLYLVGNAAYTGVWRMNQYEKWSVTDRVIMRGQGLEALYLFMGAGAFILLCRKWDFKPFFKVMTWVLIAFSCVKPGGLIGNYGMNAAVLACLLPFGGRYAILPILFFILSSGASTPLLVAGAVGFWVGRRYWYIGCLLAMSCGTAIWKLAPHYFNDSSRFENWRIYWEQIQHSPWFGHGAGSFAVLGPAIQGLSGEKGNWLVFAHNEYLQILFEYGWVGMLLIAVSFAVMFFRYREDPMFQASLLGFAAASVTDFPLRLAVPMFIIVVLIKEMPRVREGY